ncbi:MAG: hypothetical protein QOJ09_827 [Actinomycetota bacterium]|jgi:hypothetical protein|nr:hypothetical protein [Actinomycetota bacterium]
MKRTHAWVAFVAGVNLALASVAGLLIPAHAQTAPPVAGIGGYTLSATAAATRQIFKPENNIIPAENLLDLSMPYSTAQLSQGSSHAVGSTVWPGDTLATACRASDQVPCYPFFAESFFPQGPTDGKAPQEIPGSTMAAHSEEQEAVGKSEYTPQGGGGNSVGASTSTSTSSIKTGTAVAESVSRASDIILGAGVIRIESVVSHAKAVSDGTTGDAAGSTAVVGFTIAGFPVAVTQDGVSIAGQINTGNPLLPAVDPVNAALQTIGASVQLSKPKVTKDGPRGEVVAGGLIITLDNSIVLGNVPPEAKANFPVDPTGKTTLVFGSASATSEASPGFGDGSVVEDLPPVVADLTESAPADFSPGDSVAVSTDTATPVAGATPISPARVQAVSAVAPVDGKAVGLGLVLLALAGAVAAAVGLKRLGTGLFEPISATSCPQEKT